MIRYVVIPHLEPCISPWILSEYRFVSKLFGRDAVVFTNIRKKRDGDILKKLGRVFRGDFREFIGSLGIDVDKVLVLDPKVKERLGLSDVRECYVAIIGGIMGDYPPRGRTWTYISSKLRGARIRSLHDGQLTIAGVAYVLKKVIEGIPLSKLDFIEGIKIKAKLLGFEHEIYLPYVFPLENGEPVVPEDYYDVVRYGTTYFEAFIDRCLDEDEASG